MATWDSLSERQRDAWLHEHVFGEDEVRIKLVGTGTLIASCYRHGNWINLPHYTTDLTAAMGLAEEMATKEYSYTLNCYPWFDPKYVASFWLPGESGQHVTKADTLPEAIAHAAWLALGGE